MRKDGIRLKNAEPMYTVAAHIMDKRTDSMNMITLDIMTGGWHLYVHHSVP